VHLIEPNRPDAKTKAKSLTVRPHPMFFITDMVAKVETTKRCLTNPALGLYGPNTGRHGPVRNKRYRP
jgi:hypothetical protein